MNTVLQKSADEPLTIIPIAVNLFVLVSEIPVGLKHINIMYALVFQRLTNVDHYFQ